MSNLKLGDWEITDPGYSPAPGDLGTADILGTTYQTVIMPDGKEWTAANLVYTGAGGVWWGGGGSDDGDGRYYSYAECLAVHALLSEGWRVPDEADSDALYAGLNALHPGTEGQVLKSTGTTYWNASAGNGGLDTYGFGLHGAGYQTTTAFLWYLKRRLGRFWVRYTTAPSATGFYIGTEYDIKTILPRNVSTSDRISMRLVRDPIPVPPTSSSGTHDLLVLPNGRAETTESLAQRVDVRLRTFIGEHWLNPELGVPWFEEFLRKAPDLAACRQILIAVIQDVPGIETIDSLEVAFSKSTRQMRVSFAVSGSDSIPQSGLTAVPL